MKNILQIDFSLKNAKHDFVKSLSETGFAVIKNHDIVHGKTSEIYNDNSSVLYNGVPSVFTATRYHSLIIEKSSISNDFRIN